MALPTYSTKKKQNKHIILQVRKNPPTFDVSILHAMHVHNEGLFTLLSPAPFWLRTVLACLCVMNVCHQL